MQRLPVYILAGGQSARFGSDKARAAIRGVPLIVALAQTLAPVTQGAVIVVADRADKYADLGLHTIADLSPAQGPLGGLQAALIHRQSRADAPGGWLLAVSCDWVGLRAAWIERLCRALMAADAKAAGAPAAPDAPRAAAFRGERWEPLLALYHTDLLPKVSQALAGPDRALWRVLEAGHAAAVPLPEDWAAMGQVNTPEALAAWLGRQIPKPGEA